MVALYVTEYKKMVGVVREKYQLFPKNINFVYFNLSVGYFTSLAKDS